MNNQNNLQKHKDFLAPSEQNELTSLIKAEMTTDQIVVITNKIVSLAVDHRASDVHLEPGREHNIVRFRVDGILYDVIDLSMAVHEAIIARIKVIADLRTDEHRIPQDGRFSGQMEKVFVDFRVSVVPTIFGEKIAIRVLRQNIGSHNFSNLGFTPEAQALTESNLQKPYGMILVCGPTGVGKTTTLYTLLQFLIQQKKKSSNFNTIEDPVEYVVERVNQIQVNAPIGLTFSTALRGLLRQDTDIIMVGEIRDRETAEAATQASLTGRLLLSSLHTRNAVGAIVRLSEIGIEPYLIASAVTAIVSQRLVRLICRSCLASYKLDETVMKDLNQRFDLNWVIDLIKKDSKFKDLDLDRPTLFRGKGCDDCHHTGYRGRKGIFEVLEITDTMRELIQQRSRSSVLHDLALKEGMVTMFQDGFKKALMGETTLEEVLRVSLD